MLTTDDLLDLALSFCTEDALRAAYASCRAFRAAAVPHLRRLLSIALVGAVSSSRAGAGAGGRAGTPPAEATQCLWRLCRRRAARPSPVSRTLLRAERAERRGW